MTTGISFEPIPNGLKNERIKTKHLEPPWHPPHLFPLHTLGVFVGARNSGKTNACTLLVEGYMEKKAFHRVFIISPTYDANKSLQTLPIQDPTDVYKDVIHSGDKALHDIIKKVEEAAKLYEEDKEYKKVWERYKAIRSTMHDYIALEARNFEPPKNIPKPVYALIIDDMSHTTIYSTARENPFVSLCLRHRHLFEVGISIFMLVQTFKSGVPYALRNNVQQFFIWKTRDMKVLEGMYNEFGNLCSWGQFLEVFETATDEPKQFLTVDIYNEDEDHIFRSNFDTYIKIPNSFSLTKHIIFKEKRKMREMGEFIEKEPLEKDKEEGVKKKKKRRKEEKPEMEEKASS